MLRHSLFCACAVGAVSCAAGSASAQYYITGLGTVPGGIGSVAYGVNNAGQVVGYASQPPNGSVTEPYAFLWTSQSGMTNLGTIFGQNSGLSYAVGIDSAGDAVGFAKPINGHAFLYNGTAMTDLYNGAGATYNCAIQSYSGGNLNVALGKGIAINDKGDMVGHYAGGSGDFFWANGGNSIDLGNLGGGNSQAGATAINDSDVVVGNSAGGGINPAEQPWVWTSSGGLQTLFNTQTAGVALAIDNSDNVVGQIGTGGASPYAFIARSAGGTVPFATACTNLGMLSGDASSIAWSVANGTVAGQSVNGSGTARAVVWKGSIADGYSIADLNTEIPSGTGWDLTCAYGISSNGYIVGAGTTGGETEGFLLTPVLPGDVNGDGRVDINDLTIVLANYGKTAGMSWGTGDLVGDGTVDINDLTIVLANYGKTYGAAGVKAVPEPGGAFVFRRRTGWPVGLRMVEAEMTLQRLDPLAALRVWQISWQGPSF